MATENLTRSTDSLKAPRLWRVANRTGQNGTKEQLLRAGVPAAWLADLPAPGKKRGCRSLFDAGAQVYVSVGERGIFYVQIEQQFDASSLSQRRGRAFASFMQSAVSGGTPS